MVGKLSSIKLLEYKYFSSHSTLDDLLREIFFFFFKLKTQALGQGGDLKCMTYHIST